MNMKLTIFLRDENVTEIVSVILPYHFSMFSNKINIQLQEKNDFKNVSNALIENNIAFEFKGNSIKLDTHSVNIRIDKTE